MPNQIKASNLKSCVFSQILSSSVTRSVKYMCKGCPEQFPRLSFQMLVQKKFRATHKGTVSRNPILYTFTKRDRGVIQRCSDHFCSDLSFCCNVNFDSLKDIANIAAILCKCN